MPIRCWQEWERFCARNGRRIKGSGNRTVKGDVERPDEIVECKFTTRDYYTLKLSDLQALHRAARQHNKPPVIELYVGGAHLRIVRIDEHRYETDRKSWRIRLQMVGERIETPYGCWQVCDGSEDPTT